MTEPERLTVPPMTPAQAGEVLRDLGAWLRQRRDDGLSSTSLRFDVGEVFVELARRRFPELVTAEYRVRAGQGGSPLDSVAGSPEGCGVTRLLATYDEAGAALACSLSKVKRLVADGQLTAVRVGGAARIRITDLEVFVAGLPARTDGVCP